MIEMSWFGRQREQSYDALRGWMTAPSQPGQACESPGGAEREAWTPDSTAWIDVFIYQGREFALAKNTDAYIR